MSLHDSLPMLVPMGLASLLSIVCGALTTLIVWLVSRFAFGRRSSTSKGT